MRMLLAVIALLFLGCGTHLTSTDTLAEQANQTLALGGYKDHAGDDGGLDKLRYQAIYCSSGGVLLRAGYPSDGGADGAPQCPTRAP
jgi:hypothetical protein